MEGAHTLHSSSVALHCITPWLHQCRQTAQFSSLCLPAAITENLLHAALIKQGPHSQRQHYSHQHGDLPVFDWPPLDLVGGSAHGRTPASVCWVPGCSLQEHRKQSPPISGMKEGLSAHRLGQMGLVLGDESAP